MVPPDLSGGHSARYLNVFQAFSEECRDLQVVY